MKMSVRLLAAALLLAGSATYHRYGNVCRRLLAYVGRHRRRSFLYRIYRFVLFECFDSRRWDSPHIERGRLWASGSLFDAPYR